MLPHAYPPGAGWIEVITGCMFSGKTEELLRRIRLARIARQRVILFKPLTDVRYSANEVVSHADTRIPCVPVATSSDILRRVDDVDVVGVDEAQFFDAGLPGVLERLAGAGLRVVVAGLDLDYRGRPFEPMPEILALAEFLTKTHAVCTVCGATATRTQRIVRHDTRVLLGAEDAYEARCRRHWHPEHFDPEQEALPLPGRAPHGH